MPTILRSASPPPAWAPQDGEACRVALPALRMDGAAGHTEWVINTTQQDRHGTVIPADRLDLSGYRANPVVFLNHASWDLPIGRSEVSLSTDGASPTLVARMSDGDLSDGGDWDLKSERAADTYRLVKGGVLRGASIGFRGEWDRELIDPQGDPYDWKNIRLTLREGELIEWSPVGVPSNPGALVTARMLGTRMGDPPSPDARLVVPVTTDLSGRTPQAMCHRLDPTRGLAASIAAHIAAHARTSGHSTH